MHTVNGKETFLYKRKMTQAAKPSEAIKNI